MNKILPIVLLSAACAPDGPDQDAPEAFDRVENRTDATVVLADPEEWAFGGHRWKSDCDDDASQALSIVVDGGTLIVSGSGSAIDGTCNVLVQTGNIGEMVCQGNGDLHHLGDLSGLSTIRVTGNGEVDLDVLMTDHLDLFALGNGQITIRHLLAPSLTLDLGGNGDVVLGGIVHDARFDISGNGNLDAQALILQDLYIDMTGSGTAVVTVEGSIDGSINGNGQLDVFGLPTGSVDTMGSGVVTLHE